MQTGGKKQRKENQSNKKKEAAQRERGYFKALKFDKFHLKKKNNYMRKCNQCRQNFEEESYVIAFKLMVPRRGTKLQDGLLTERTVHIHVRNDCMRKAKCNPKDIMIPEFYGLTSNELDEIAERGKFKF